MPVPACLRLADDVFPLVRVLAAQRLTAEGWTQARTAEALGVSQAMVSQYLRREPPTVPLVVRLAEQLVQDIDSAPDGLSPWCTTLATPSRPGGQEALDDILGAEEALRTAPPHGLIPEIGINIARSLPGAEGPDDVLSYPARIVAAGDRLVTPLPPIPGASRHLAACLLAHRAADPAVHALISVRGGPAAEAAARRIGGLATLPAKGDREDGYSRTVTADTPFIHDAGAFGIEPCLYVSGPDARTAVQTVRRIAQEIQ